MKIALIKGDGIGPEISEVACKVLKTLVPEIEFQEVMAGEQALEQKGSLLPEETLKTIADCKLAIKGPLNTPSAGGFRSINVTLRQHFELYANIRPVKSYPNASKRFDSVDLVLFRENVEGLYSGEGQVLMRGANVTKNLDEADRAEAKSVVTRKGCENIIRAAYNYAVENKRKKVTIVHKSNILKTTSGLFLSVGKKIAEEYPQIQTDTMIADAVAMKLVIDPKQFDVLVTTNFVGDVLSDLCAGLVGGLGLAPGANVGGDVFISEAVHGTAPDIAGKNMANPSALILACKMLLEKMGKQKEAKILEESMVELYQEKVQLTKDVGGQNGTKEFGEALCKKIQEKMK
jgi:isocitrate dehydrogenase (NAD+)